jgi:peptide/nickel transport system substrate-binding protein
MSKGFKNMNKRIRTIIALFLGLSLLLGACGPIATDEATVPPEDAPEATIQPVVTEEVEEPEEMEEPVTLNVGWLEPIDCWTMSGCQSFWTWGDLVLDTLMGKGYPNCTGTPRMAESWEVSEDNLTWTIKLVEGGTFSDGTPADAQAVADFIEWRASIPSLAGWFHSVYSLDSIEAVDETTLKWTTTEPSPTLIIDQQFNYVRPMSVWEEYTEETVFDYTDFPPIGSGPYAVTEYVEGSHAIFEARPDYPGGKPPIDRLVWRFYSNPDSLVNAFLSGEVDITGRLPAEYYDILAGEENVIIFEQVATNKYELEFNLFPEGAKHPAIDDLSVRQAIDYAIDKQQIIDVALLGRGAICPTNWACPPNMPNQLNPDLVAIPQDFTMANQILDDAGYLDTDGDGVRENPEGLPMELRLNFQQEDAPQLTIADMIAGWLREIGISVDTEALEFGMVSQGVLNERDFDMLIYNMYTDVSGPMHMDYTISCWAAESGAVGRNYPGWCNEEFDSLMYEAYFTFDEEVFETSLFDAQAILNQEKPYITLAGINNFQAYNNEKFEFMHEVCHESEGGLTSYYPLMNANVK